MKNSITFTREIIETVDIEIANPDGFQYAVISRGSNFSCKYTPYDKPIIYKNDDECIIALFTHKGYADTFLDSLSDKNFFYIRKIKGDKIWVLRNVC
jgi:hypothetical protein